MNNEVVEIREEERRSKRGRKPKNYRKEYIVNTKQSKFIMDLSGDKLSSAKLHKLLESVNKKDFGRELIFKDLVVYALDKIDLKDIKVIQENSLSEMEKVERALVNYNIKNSSSLTLGEFLLKKLNLN